MGIYQELDRLKKEGKLDEYLQALPSEDLADLLTALEREREELNQRNQKILEGYAEGFTPKKELKDIPKDVLSSFGHTMNQIGLTALRGVLGGIGSPVSPQTAITKSKLKELETSQAKAREEIAQPYLSAPATVKYPFLIGENIARNLPALTAGILSRNPNIALGMFGGQATLEAIPEEEKKTKEAGLPDWTAYTQAMNIGALETLTEVLPFKALFGTGKLIPKAIKAIGYEVIGEELNQIAEDLLDRYVYKEDASNRLIKAVKEENPIKVAEVIAQDLKDLYANPEGMQRLIDTAIISAGSMGVITGITHPILKAYERPEAKEKAKEGIKKLEEAVKLSEEIKKDLPKKENKKKQLKEKRQKQKELVKEAKKNLVEAEVLELEIDKILKDKNKDIRQKKREIKEKLENRIPVIQQLQESLKDIDLTPPKELAVDRETVKRIIEESRAKELENRYTRLDLAFNPELPEDILNKQFEILEKIKNAEAGYRVRNDKGEWIGIPSSFPDWIPKEYRRKEYLDKVWNAIVKQVPPKEGTKARDLYEIVIDRLLNNAGVSGVKEEDIENIDVFTGETETAQNIGTKTQSEENKEINLKEVPEEEIRQAENEYEGQLFEKAKSIKSLDEAINIQKEAQKIKSKTLKRIRKGQFSTPIDLSFVLQKALGISKDDTVYEPTAGTGLLVFRANPDKTLVNEIDPERIKVLKRFFKNIKNEDAVVWRPNKTFDVVIANPPFLKFDKAIDYQGHRISKADYLIALKALEAMKDNGRAGFILSGNITRDIYGKKRDGFSKEDKAFLSYLYSNYNVVKHADLSPEFFKPMGVNYPTQIIIIKGKKEKPQLPRVNFDDIPYITNIRDLDKYLNEEKENDERREARTSEPSDRTDVEVRRGERKVSELERSTEDKQRQPDMERVSDRSRPTGSDRGRTEAVRERREMAEGTEGVEKGRNEPTRSDTNRPDIRHKPRVEEKAKTTPDVKEKTEEIKTKEPSKTEEQIQTEEQRQVRYKPRSKGKDLGQLIPASMEKEIYEALDRLEKEVGDIDQYVKEKLRYKSLDELYDAFHAGQIDALALALYNIETKGQGFILGDMTGAGKGRVNAGVLKYAVEEGHIPIFYTVKPNLFSDIFRDAKDIGFTDFRPFILNKDNSTIYDENGNEIFKSPLKNKKFEKQFKEIINTKEKDDIIKFLKDNGYNVILTTYSQIQGTKAWQKTFLSKVSPNNIISLDESHNAGGESNTGEFIRNTLKYVKGVLYSSATYAKNPKTLKLYYKTAISETGLTPEELEEALINGGEPLAEVIAQQLTKEGQYIRRELDFSDAKYETFIDDFNKEFYVNAYNKVMDIYRDILTLNNRVSEIVKQRANKLKKELQAQNIDIKKGFQPIQATELLNTTYSFVNQTLLALKSSRIADEVIKAFKEGKKPVITLMNTNEGLLNEIIEQEGYQVGDEIDFTFKELLLNRLKRALTYKVKSVSTGLTEKEAVFKYEDLNDEQKEIYDRIIKKIESFDLDLPASPIDAIKSKLQEAGIKVGEITGRAKYIEYKDGKAYLRNRPAEEIKDRNKTIQRFNDGRLDAIIFNSAGSTGISLHASEKFKDQKPRKMFILQPLLDINQYVQTLGRIHRTGQVNPAEYSLIQTPLPSELRFAIFLERKMKMLNATTTAKTKDKKNLDVPDFFNKYGDDIAFSFLLDNQSLARSLGLTKYIMTENGRPLSQTPPDIMKKLTGRIAVLPVEEQEQIYEELTRQYENYIEELKSTGEYDLETEILPIDGKTIIKAKLAEGKEGSFGEPLYFETVLGKTLRKPYNRNKILKLLKEIGITNKEKALAKQEKIYKQIKIDTNRYLDQSPLTETAKRTITNQLLTLQQVLKDRYIGQTLISPDGHIAVILNISYTRGSITNPLNKGRFEFILAVPDSRQTIKAGWKDVALMDEYNEWVSEDWDDVLEDTGREVYNFITGNVLKGALLKDGKAQIVEFTDEQGNLRRGIKLPKKLPEELKNKLSQKEISYKELKDELYLRDKDKAFRDTTGNIAFAVFKGSDVIYAYFRGKKSPAEAFLSYWTSQNKKEYAKEVEEFLLNLSPDLPRIKNFIFGKKETVFRIKIKDEKLDRLLDFLKEKGIKFTTKLTDEDVIYVDLPYSQPDKKISAGKLLKGHTHIKYDSETKILFNPYAHLRLKVSEKEAKGYPEKESYEKPVNPSEIIEEVKDIKVSTKDLAEGKHLAIVEGEKVKAKVKKLFIDYIKTRYPKAKIYIAKDSVVAKENDEVVGEMPAEVYSKKTETLYSGIPLQDTLKQVKGLIQAVKKKKKDLVGDIGIDKDISLMEKLFVQPQFSKRKSLNSIYRIFRESQELKQEEVLKLYEMLNGEEELYIKMKDLGIRDAFRDALVLLDKKTRELTRLERERKKIEILENAERELSREELRELANEAVLQEGLGEEAKELLYVIAKKHSLNGEQTEALIKLYENWLNLTRTIRERLLEIFENELSKSKNPTLIKRLKLQMGQLKYYFPRYRDQGNWEVRVLDEKGRVVFAKFYDLYKGQWMLKKYKVEKELKKRYPEDKYTIDWRPAFNYNDVIGESINPLTLERFIDATLDKLQKQGKDEELIEDFQKVLYEQVANALKSKGFLSHTIRRSRRHIEGYETEDIEGVIGKFLNAFAGFEGKLEMAERFKDVLESIPKENYKERKTVQEVIQFLLRNETFYDRVSGRLRSFIFLYSLGFKPSFALVNLTQTGLTTYPYLAKEAGFKEAGKAVPKAMKKALYILRHVATKKKEVEFLHKKPEGLTDEEYEAVKKIIKSGILENMISEYRGDIGGKLQRRYEKFIDASAKLASLSEMYNRITSFLSYYYANKGKIPEDELLDKAEEFTLKTQFDYSKGNLPIFIQESKGRAYAFWRTAYTFRHYIVSLFNLYREMGWLSPYTLASLGILALIGGVASLPIYFFIDALFKEMTGVPLSFVLKEKLGDMSNYLMYGFLSATGLTLQPQMSLNIPFIDTEFNKHNPFKSFDELVMWGLQETLGVVYGVVDSLFRGTAGTLKAVKHMTEGKKEIAETEFKRASEYLIPVAFLRYLEKAVREYTEGVSTYTGKPVEVLGQQIKLDEKEAIGEALGLSPVKKVEYYQTLKNIIDIKERLQEEKNELYMALRDAYLKKDKDKIKKIIEDIREYNKKVLEKYPDFRNMLITSPSIRRVLKGKRDKTLDRLLYKWKKEEK